MGGTALSDELRDLEEDRLNYLADEADRQRKIDKETQMEIAELTTHPEIVLWTGDRQERMNQMKETAAILAEPIRQTHMVKIGSSEHVRVEGWTMLGSLLGVYPILVWSRPINEGLVEALGEARRDPHPTRDEALNEVRRAWGWEARVEARTRSGELVGAAEAMCTRSEKTWANREEYALRSMSQTRATSKALRQPLGFVITLAGFDPTPAEEVPRETDFQAPDTRDEIQPPLTGAQNKKIRALLAKLQKADEEGFSDEAVARALDISYRVKSVSELSQRQASNLIDKLEARETELSD